MIEVLPRLVIEENNIKIKRIPTVEEIKGAVMSLNRTSVGGPDGITGAFFQDAWDNIAGDLYQMVVALFCGSELPRFISHTNLILLPKKEVVNTFLNLRPISFSNFMNKIFFKTIHKRVKGLLTNIVLEEQAGFMQGRSIIENILVVIDKIFRLVSNNW